AGGGVWKTSNDGITWRDIGDSLGVTTIGDIEVAPSDTNVVWVGTGEKNSLRSQSWGNGVHKSTDGGRTWHHMGLADTKAIGKIVIDPRDPNTVYVAALGHLWGPNAERGVFKTTDGGATWTKVLYVDDSTGVVDLVMSPGNPDVLYAAAWHRVRWGGSHMQGVGAGSGIYRTGDGGHTWQRLTDPARRNGLPNGHMGRIGLAVTAADPHTVYAMIQVDEGVTDADQRRSRVRVVLADARIEGWRQVVRARLAAPRACRQPRPVDGSRRCAPHAARQRRWRVSHARRRESMGAHGAADRAVLYGDRRQLGDALSHLRRPAGQRRVVRPQRDARYVRHHRRGLVSGGGRGWDVGADSVEGPVHRVRRVPVWQHVAAGSAY